MTTPQEQAQRRRTERARKRRAHWTGAVAPRNFWVNFLRSTQFEAVSMAREFAGAGFSVYRFNADSVTVQTTKADQTKGDWIVTVYFPLTRLKDFIRQFGLPRTMSVIASVQEWASSYNLTLEEAWAEFTRDTGITKEQAEEDDKWAA